MKEGYSTFYALATHAGDYRAVSQFLRENKVECEGLSFPTIYARREDEVVGVMGTQPRKDAIVAGPLFVNTPGNDAIVGKRLVESYEYILNKAGVSVYNYMIDRADTKWLSSLRKTPLLHVEMETSDPEVVWFRRRLK